MLKVKILGLAVLMAGVVLGQTTSSLNMTSLGSKSYVQNLNDIWGWTDSTGTEYALVGTTTGFSIVDISTPSNPVEKFFISGPNSTWRDIKTWGHYAYVTHDSYSGISQGLLIVDLSDIDTAQSISYTTYFYTHTDGEQLDRAHNLYIDENGRCYLFGSNIGLGGALMFDLTNNPTSPSYVGIYDEYYLHDGMARGDTMWGGAIWEGKFVAIDVSTPSSPVNMGSATTPNAFCHNAWISQDGETVFTTDELTGSFVAAYDVTNLSNIQELDRVQPYPGTGVIPHNAHVSGKMVVTSWYTAGVRVHDATYPYNMVEIGYFDTSPLYSGTGYNGNWGAYPFFPSGIIACSDMENGLHLLQPDYTNACWLEGNITDGATNLPISAALVEILGQSNKGADVAGFYATGVANGGTYDVVYSKPGYHSDTISTVLTIGVLVTQDVQLNAFYTFDINGQVTNNSGSAISGAQVTISNSQISFSGTTNSSGSFNVPSIFDGVYEVVVSAWGYQTECYTDHLDSTNYTVSVQLEKGYYDDFTTDMGWMVQSTASTGIWVRDEPIGTLYGPAFFNPDADLTGDCGNQAYITGNGGGQAGTDDVDAGQTTLMSPVMDLTSYVDPYLSYYTWFANSGGSGTPNDSLVVEITNGLDKVELEHITASSPQSQWVKSQWHVEDHIAKTADVRVSFRATDYTADGGHLVEAGVDQFMVWDSTSIGLEEANLLNIQVFPNPTSGWIQIQYEWSHVDTQLEILDLSGRIILQRPLHGRRGETAIFLDVDKGVYLLRFSENGVPIRTERIIVQ